MNKIFFSLILFVSGTNLLFSQSDSLVVKGLAKQKEGKHEPAITAFSESIKKDEAEVQEYVKKWDEYQKFTDFERAEKGMEAPKINAAFARPYYLRGISYEAMKKDDEAMNDFDMAAKVSPKSGNAYYERGKLLWLAGKKYEGCCDLSMARSLDDSLAKEMFDEKFCWNEGVLFYKDALSKLKLNQYEMALDLIQKSIQLSPDSMVYLVVRGKSYLGMGKLDLAFPDFDKAIAALPNNADAYFGRGMAFYNKKKYQEAFDDLDKAIGINAKLTDAYLYRAYTCEGLNMVQSALFDYQQVQRLRPNDPLAYYKSGLLKNENNDHKGACADFKKAAALGSDEAADYAKSCK